MSNAGEGLITTSLHFMPDVESPCPICKGARYNEATLEVTYAGKNIAEILDMTVEKGETFFSERPYLCIRSACSMRWGWATCG